MADPILHIKDAYYFEVPKALWRANYTAADIKAMPYVHAKGATLADYNRELSGKIIIPQPFGQLKNLHECESGFCISKFMIIELVVGAVLVLIVQRVARRIATGAPPEGIMTNMFEAVLVFVRDEIARPAIGDHDADRFVPILWTQFLFILGCNLMGLIPWVGAPTGSWDVTLSLAAITFFTVLIGGMLQFGPIGFWLNQAPHMDLPWFMFPLKVAIWFIEVVGLLIKHAILSVRLLANMMAGHVVLLGIMGLILAAAHASQGMFATVATISVLGSVAFTFLELLVAFLQAYIFVFLSALFIGAAVHHH